jgi:Pyruvate phosphate dikinase, PEP/pyruvate binding domain.
MEHQVKQAQSKAEILEILHQAGFNVPPLLYFSVQEWFDSQDTVLVRIKSSFGGAIGKIAVRSSCRQEDTVSCSNAGVFESILNVPVDQENAICQAVKQVIDSYGVNTAKDQVLIQQMVVGTVMSGVIMTRAADDGAPYYVLNYDDETSQTDTVTSGVGGKTVYVYRGFRNTDFDSPRLLELVYLARRLENFFHSDALDIEFCRDLAGCIYVLQVRPIAVAGKWAAEIVDQTAHGISFVEDFVERLSSPRPGLFGQRTLFGVMPDWNPAEIIGVTPRPLATSLYRHLITQRVWSLAREKMGYRSVPPEELMLILAGRPYIDVRCSFNSFLAAGILDDTAELLVNAWLDAGQNPELHDKVEFGIVSTVYDFTFQQTIAARYPGLLSGQRFDQVSSCYQYLTRQNVSAEASSPLMVALGTLERLVMSQKSFHDSCVLGKQPYALLAWVRKLLEECRTLGTLPFSMIARHAFMAEALLRSAVDRHAMLPERLRTFRKSVKTITSVMSTDMQSVAKGGLSPGDFMSRYGHLRPGTYDILSPRYADRPEVLAGLYTSTTYCHEPFELEPAEKRNLDQLLHEAGLGHLQAEELLLYAEKAIAGREYAKFIFTRSLSDALESLAVWGDVIGLTRDDLSWLNIEDLLRVSIAPLLSMPREYFEPLIRQGKNISDAGKNLKLGYLIRSCRDVYVVPQHRSTPNWVTRRHVEGKVVRLDSTSRGDLDLNGCIVCIENADPGYDWLFTRCIAGLVTQYGGANSHMAIRCSENDIPAAIGCGQILFDKVAAAKRCELDAERQSLHPL